MQHDQAAALARRILNLRAKRSDHLPDVLFGEIAWGLLLVLFIADADGQHITADEACQRAGGPLAVARRWLTVLEQEGLAACDTACEDGHLISLTPAGIHGVELCMEDACQSGLGAFLV